MSPTAKFNSLLAGTTVFIMYFMVTRVGPLLHNAEDTHPFLLPIGAFLTSFAVYGLLSKALRLLMMKCELVQALVLGPFYMNGTWVGWFKGHSNEFRYMVEHFEQTLDSLVIRGWSYTCEGVRHGDWQSDSVTIDAVKGQLRFTYLFNVHTGSNALHGLHTSSFQRKSCHHAPDALAGLAHDLNDETRIPVQSFRVSNKLLSLEEGLTLATSKFQHLHV